MYILYLGDDYMEARLQKWGNSFGIRIPSNMLKSLNLKVNDLLSAFEMVKPFGKEINANDVAIVIIPPSDNKIMLFFINNSPFNYFLIFLKLRDQNMFLIKEQLRLFHVDINSNRYRVGQKSLPAYIDKRNNHLLL